MLKRPFSFLLLIVLLVAPAWAQPARIIFLGENHTSASDHQGQLEVLKGLDGTGLVVAAEMFTSRSNAFLGKWNLGEAEMDPELWESEWGHPYDLYSEIFDWTRQPVVLAALRPNPELTRRVKEGGPLAAVSQIGEMLVGPAEYRDMLRAVFASHLPTDVPLTEEMLDKYFLVQCFWDEYMAWRLSQLADQYPEHRIAVLVGYGHLDPQFGIPARLKRRRPDLTMLNIAFDKEQSEKCDLVWTIDE